MDPASPPAVAGKPLEVTAPSLYLDGIPHDRFAYGEELGERRRAEPAEDLVTELVRAADGGRLSPAEYRNFFQLLVFLEEILERRVALQRAGEPQRIASNFVHGVASVDMEPVGPEP